MATITVPASFVSDFEYLCARMDLSRSEAQKLREDVRRDFATMGTWVVDTVKAYRFCDETWNGVLPTAELAEGYLNSMGQWPELALLKTMGPVLLAQLCVNARTERRAADPPAVS